MVAGLHHLFFFSCRVFSQQVPEAGNPIFLFEFSLNTTTYPFLFRFLFRF